MTGGGRRVAEVCSVNVQCPERFVIACTLSRDTHEWYRFFVERQLKSVSGEEGE